MCPNRGWFSTHETLSKGVVLMRSNASGKIASIGTVKIKMFNGVIRTLGDMRHVLDLKRRLISLSTLDSKGYKYTGEGKILKVRKKCSCCDKMAKKVYKIICLARIHNYR